MSNHCANCGSAITPGARFCTNCGTAVSPNNDNSPYSAPAAQNYQSPNMAAEFIYAGFWKRLIAYIIDAIVIFIITFLIAMFGLGISLTSFGSSDAVAVGQKVLLLYFGFFILRWMYFALLESSSGQATLGKRALGIKVTDIQGQRLSFVHAAGRQLAGVISNMTLLIGYLMAAFTGRKQALHDMIANCVVVNKHFDSAQIYNANMNPPRGMGAGGIIAIIALVLIIPVGGILAAIAIPAYHDYTVRVQVNGAYSQARELLPAVTEFALEQGTWPSSLEQTGLDSSNYQHADYRIQLERNGTIAIYLNKPQAVSNGMIYLAPELTSSGEYDWKCFAQNLKDSYLPVDCRE
ncbi:RDD family protein [Aliikangiella sp. G2MR2-5]|uniref:RDD family protein n=1 Tax=Aliikangiella sp. G2MR2-5 TaxID=2788943 RepID=UPI0018AACD00|nr:RDD family protein [Aliikangiella sp. G2MR2-5]